MASDRLYDLAVQYRKAKLWKKLTERQLFAVGLPDGERAYCSVMGAMGEHLALGVYCGSKGFASLRELGEIKEEMPESERIFRAFGQDCMQCAFEFKDMIPPEELEEIRDYGKRHHVAFRGSMAYPRLLRYRPYRTPLPLTDSEEEIMALALEAALAVNKELEQSKNNLLLIDGSFRDRKIPILEKEGEKFRWSEIPLPEATQEFVTASLSNEILAGKVKRTKRKGELLCELLLVPSPVADEEDADEGFMPVALLILDGKTGMAFPSDLIKDFPAEKENLLVSLAETMLQEKIVPRSIRVRTDRTYAFLEDFCKQTSIKLNKSPEDSLPILDEVGEGMIDHVLGDEYPEDDEEYEGGHGSAMLPFLLAALEMATDKELKGMPRELKDMIRQLFGTGVLPEHMERRMKKIFK